MLNKVLSIFTTIIAITVSNATLAAESLPFGYAQMYTLEVSDPAALLTAMQKFRSYATGLTRPQAFRLHPNLRLPASRCC